MRLSYRKMKGGVVSEHGQRFWENFFFEKVSKNYIWFFWGIFGIFGIFGISDFRIEKTKFGIQKLFQRLFPIDF